ncbi:MAG TPA: hypothetical protein ENJ96_10010 [Thermodesulfatator atlanticus]|uniref:Thioredoxin-like fold domain-containing protein n=1 Tax=Thermodesulfatator atlanticus TaxID=501497 RepID=A0A7V5P1L0_9BACT|nr:hypothetical protein [Thermodesulfatator atlanticus]
MHSDILKLEILYSPKCRSYQELELLLRQVLAELNVPYQLSTREIKDLAEAQKINFFGSPTVKVNGQELEPEAGGRITLA